MGGVNDDGPDVVRVGLEGADLLQSVVVVHSHLHIVRPTHYPALPHDKLGRPH